LLDLYLEIDWCTINIDNSFLGLSWDQIDERARLHIWQNLVDHNRLIIVLCDPRALQAISTSHASYRKGLCFVCMGQTYGFKVTLHAALEVI
jgi:hypothetical protein